MWGGDSYVNEYLTPYVVEFLEDARDEGFAVPDDMLQKALKRLNDDLLSGGHPYYGYEHSDHLRFADEAYSGYVLARVNRAPLGTLRALYDNERAKSLTALPLVHLGIALKLMGDEPRAEKAIAEAFAKKTERPWYLGDYGSDLRDTALMVALTHRYGLNKPEYDGRVFDLARSMTTDQHSSRRSATPLRLPLGVSRDAGTDRDRTARQDADQGRRHGGFRHAFDRRHIDHDQSRTGCGAANSPAPICAPACASRRKAICRCTRRPTSPAYRKTAPASDDRYVWIERRFYTLDGKPWEPGPLKEGDSLIVGIKIEARKEMPDALLTDLLPGGLEIENFNLTDAKQWADVVVDGITVTDRGAGRRRAPRGIPRRSLRRRAEARCKARTRTCSIWCARCRPARIACRRR